MAIKHPTLRYDKFDRIFNSVVLLGASGWMFTAILQFFHTNLPKHEVDGMLVDGILFAFSLVLDYSVIYTLKKDI